MKYNQVIFIPSVAQVALFARAWIEIWDAFFPDQSDEVALFARAWIEIPNPIKQRWANLVALFARAWIEMVQSAQRAT